MCARAHVCVCVCVRESVHVFALHTNFGVISSNKYAREKAVSSSSADSSADN